MHLPPKHEALIAYYAAMQSQREQALRNNDKARQARNAATIRRMRANKEQS